MFSLATMTLVWGDGCGFGYVQSSATNGCRLGYVQSGGVGDGCSFADVQSGGVGGWV